MGQGLGEVGLGDAELGLGNSGQASAYYCLGLQLATEEHAVPSGWECCEPKQGIGGTRWN